MPLVSVVVPTRNCPHFLRQCLNSIYRQTFKDYEIVVVDDWSTDDTPQVVGQMASKRLRYIRLPSHSGCSVARNAGIENSSGRIIAFLDHDDLWHPRKLERQILALEPRDALFSCTDFDFIDAAGRVLCKNILTCPDNNLMRLGSAQMFRYADVLRQGANYGYIFLPSSVMIKRSLLARGGLFDTQFKQIHYDTDFWLRMLRCCKPQNIKVCRNSLTQYRINPKQVTRQHHESLKFFRRPLISKHENKKMTGLGFDTLLDNALFLKKAASHLYCGDSHYMCWHLPQKWGSLFSSEIMDALEAKNILGPEAIVSRK